MRHVFALTATILLLAFAFASCGDDDEGSGDSGVPGKTTAAQSDTQTTSETEAAKPGECVEIPQPDPRPDGGGEKPTSELTGEYTVTFKTNCGSFTIAIDEDAGLTAASFVKLAGSGFYDDTIFHRIAPGFVIQGGDPTGTGTGGPGYTTTDPPPSDAKYPKYTVAMAKGGAEPSGTAGSQFFVMTGDAGLPPDYAIVGQVTSGTQVIDAIGKLGDPSETPTQIVAILKARVTGG